MSTVMSYQGSAIIWDGNHEADQKHKEYLATVQLRNSSMDARQYLDNLSFEEYWRIRDYT